MSSNFIFNLNLGGGNTTNIYNNYSNMVFVYRRLYWCSYMDNILYYEYDCLDARYNSYMS